MPLKDSILARLERERPNAVSGQTLAEENGVSRNAVWKAIMSLRNEGYEILSATNRGYSLAEGCDRASADLLSRLLGNRLPVYVFGSVDSTNDEAKRRIARGEERFLIVAEEQTAGRGRSGKRFFSPKDTGLYMSLAFKPQMGLSDAVGITAFAAVSVAHAIERVTGAQCGIKWVNDIYLNGRKVCGILTEAVSDFESGAVGSVIVGIGVNLRQSECPEDIRGVMGFLDCTGAVKNALAAEIAASLLSYCAADRGYMAEYKRLSVVLGRQVSYRIGGKTLAGVAVDIDEFGGLVVARPDGQKDTLRSGEISLSAIDGLKK